MGFCGAGNKRTNWFGQTRHLSMIRKLRSHNDVQSTACLAHLARDSVTGTPISHPGQSPLLDVPSFRRHVLLIRASCSGVGRAGRHGVRVTGPQVFCWFDLSSRPYLISSMFRTRDRHLRGERGIRVCRRHERIPDMFGFQFGVGQPKAQSATRSSPPTCGRRFSRNAEKRMVHVSRRRAEAGGYPAHAVPPPFGAEFMFAARLPEF